MANVLPPTAQKKLWRMYRARFIIVFSIMLATLALLAGLLIGPSYLALRIAAPPQQNTPVEGKGGATGDAVAIARTQAIALALTPLLSATTSPSSAIVAALSNRRAGIVIGYITYSADTGQLTLTGTAPRDAINAYRDALKADTRFSSVSVPVSALVGTEDGRFSVTLTVAN